MYSERVTTCGARIKEALHKRGMKQIELCEAAKMPKSALSQYISGTYEPKQDRIYIIAKILNVNEAWLMGYDVPMERDVKLNLQLLAEKTPEEPALSEGEKKLLELFRSVPEDKKELVLQMISLALKTK